MRLWAQSIDLVAAPDPLRSLEGDAAYVRDVIAGVGRPVVLVAHSYGGMVISEAAANNDAVKSLVYVCAFAPDQGESAFALSLKFPGSTLGDALNAYPVSTGGNERAGAKDVREIAGASHALSVSQPEPVTATILDALKA